MAKISIYLDTRRPDKDGACPLALSLFHQGKTRYVRIGITLPPCMWDGQRVIKCHPASVKLNNEISRLRLMAEAVAIDFAEGGRPYQAVDLAQAVSAKMYPDRAPSKPSALPVAKDSLIEAAQRFAELKSQSTRLTYERTITHLRKFRPGALLDDVNRAWLAEFEAYLKDTNPSVNGRAMHLRNLRAVFNYAIDEGLTNNYPFRRFKIKMARTPKRSLSVENLRRLWAFERDGAAMLYLDFFKLSFLLIGINAKDLLMLPAKADAAGRIEYYRAKTGRFYSVKVEPEAKAIIDRLRGSAHMISVMDSRSYYLNFLRVCDAGLSSILPGLTTYWARHTWATIASSLDIPKDTIAAALGHGDTTVTDIYIDFDQAKVDAANRRVIDWVLYGKA
ncbi:MAG: site-specific integrase [Bacteroidales bacterium]|nr:site-specific integrase [Bacteroidales bacterium]